MLLHTLLRWLLLFPLAMSALSKWKLNAGSSQVLCQTLEQRFVPTDTLASQALCEYFDLLAARSHGAAGPEGSLQGLVLVGPGSPANKQIAIEAIVQAWQHSAPNQPSPVRLLTLTPQDLSARLLANRQKKRPDEQGPAGLFAPLPEQLGEEGEEGGVTVVLLEGLQHFAASHLLNLLDLAVSDHAQVVPLLLATLHTPSTAELLDSGADLSRWQDHLDHFFLPENPTADPAGPAGAGRADAASERRAVKQLRKSLQSWRTVAFTAEQVPFAERAGELLLTFRTQRAKGLPEALEKDVHVAPLEPETSPGGSETVELAEMSPMERTIRHKFIGQSHVLHAVLASLHDLVSGWDLRPGRSPLIFVFLGPPGTGKTYLAKLIAEYLDKPLLKTEMGNFKNAEDIDSFVGPRAGIVGDCKLCAELSAEPEAVVLLDEIEKAHPSIISEFLLPIFDDGTIQDKKTLKHVDVSRSVWVLTSNCFQQIVLDQWERHQEQLTANATRNAQRALRSQPKSGGSAQDKKAVSEAQQQAKEEAKLGLQLRSAISGLVSHVHFPDPDYVCEGLNKRNPFASQAFIDRVEGRVFAFTPYLYSEAERIVVLALEDLHKKCQQPVGPRAGFELVWDEAVPRKLLMSAAQSSPLTSSSSTAPSTSALSIRKLKKHVGTQVASVLGADLRRRASTQPNSVVVLTVGAGANLRAALIASNATLPMPGSGEQELKVAVAAQDEPSLPMVSNHSQDSLPTASERSQESLGAGGSGGAAGPENQVELEREVAREVETSPDTQDQVLWSELQALREEHAELARQHATVLAENASLKQQRRALALLLLAAVLLLVLSSAALLVLLKVALLSFIKYALVALVAAAALIQWLCPWLFSVIWQALKWLGRLLYLVSGPWGVICLGLLLLVLLVWLARRAAKWQRRMSAAAALSPALIAAVRAEAKQYQAKLLEREKELTELHARNRQLLQQLAALTRLLEFHTQQRNPEGPAGGEREGRDRGERGGAPARTTAKTDQRPLGRQDHLAKDWVQTAAVARGAPVTEKDKSEATEQVVAALRLLSLTGAVPPATGEADQTDATEQGRTGDML
eukprot:g14020.t1